MKIPSYKYDHKLLHLNISLQLPCCSTVYRYEAMLSSFSLPNLQCNFRIYQTHKAVHSYQEVKKKKKGKQHVNMKQHHLTADSTMEQALVAIKGHVTI